MTYQECLKVAVTELEVARNLIQDEMRDYPTPVSGCDVQYNLLISQRGAVNTALRALETQRFVATPQCPFPQAAEKPN